MQTIKTTVQAQFGNVAEEYRKSAVHASGADIDRIVAYVQHLDRPRVLDVGCGAGHVSVALAPWSGEVVASDLTDSMLAQVRVLAQERGATNVVTQHADVERLPFEDNSFDVVVSRYSAHHWPHPAQAVRECLRVVRPGGHVLLSDIVAPDEPAFDTFLQMFEYLRDPSHVRDHTVAQWQAMFTANGATAEVLMTWDLPLGFDSWVRRMNTPQPQVDVIRHLFQTASAETREHFRIGEAGDFVIQGALFAAQL